VITIPESLITMPGITDHDPGIPDHDARNERSRSSGITDHDRPEPPVGRDARLLRGDDGVNQDYLTNSITLGGGESADVILDTTGLTPGTTYFLSARNLHFLSNDAENFGGLMTEIRIQ
jgi:hypothetical protein